jgi:hypothetical protein
MYVETTHGWYDRVVPGNKTIRPMNVHAEFWADLGWSRSDLDDAETNVRAGTMLIKKLGDRIKNPTTEKIATLYNNLSAEKVTDYGARVAEIYREKPWSDVRLKQEK